MVLAGVAMKPGGEGIAYRDRNKRLHRDYHGFRGLGFRYGDLLLHSLPSYTGALL